jgi:BirA family transcriptional regulator, biotin operon repressor / biotin---[acetyl-CoA-carboxylase] ligase
VSEALHAQSLLQGLKGLRFGHPVHLYRQIGSTNDEARRLAQAAAPEGLMVVAEEQSAGRGRAGRRWITRSGSALAFSLVLRPTAPPAQAVRLTMIAGLAVCEAIEQIAGVRAALKWPNDILLGGQKTGGILVEAVTAAEGEAGGRLEYAVLGIGINVEEAPAPDQVDFPATALQVQAGRPVDRLRLLRAILQRLEARYPAMTASDPQPLHADWAARLAWLGEPVVARTAGGEYAGQAEGADPDGALVLRLDSGERVRVLAGDVRLRLAKA